MSCYWDFLTSFDSLVLHACGLDHRQSNIAFMIYMVIIMHELHAWTIMNSMHGNGWHSWFMVLQHFWFLALLFVCVFWALPLVYESRDSSCRHCHASHGYRQVWCNIGRWDRGLIMAIWKAESLWMSFAALFQERLARIRELKANLLSEPSTRVENTFLAEAVPGEELSVCYMIKSILGHAWFASDSASPICGN